ncbi:hypothetical protein AMECASPLE_018590 [Ameca splendens]|uniref:Uncharacterized protein n=1 Tax=Ameca splendens TaxID=208324 RepID=A0ABV0ZBM0_9TELE
MFLDIERKPEYLETTHLYTGRTCKHHAKRPQAEIQIQEHIVARQQCHQLLHLADPLLPTVSQSFSTASSIVGRGEAGAYLQQSMGGRLGTLWTGHQSITGHCCQHLV